MQILVLIGLYFLKCTKFDQLILRKIIKIVATRCQILTLKCTKIDFGCGSAPDPAGGAYSALPETPLAGFKGPTSKGMGGEGMRGKRRGGGARPVCLLVLTILATGLSV